MNQDQNMSSTEALRSITKRVLDDLSNATSPDALQNRCESLASSLREIRLILVDSLSRETSLYRHWQATDGIKLIVNCLECVAENASSLDALQPADQRLLVEFLKSVLNVLAETLKLDLDLTSTHLSNSSKRLPHALERATSRLCKDAEPRGDLQAPSTPGISLLFDAVFGFALREEVFQTFLESSAVREVLGQHGKLRDQGQDQPNEAPDVSSLDSNWLDRLVAISPLHNEVVWNPIALRPVFRLFYELSTREFSGFDSLLLQVSVLTRLLQLSRSSIHNLVAVHRSGILHDGLLLLSSRSKPFPPTLSLLESLVLQLSKLGFENLDDSAIFLKLCSESSDGAKLLSRVIRGSRDPPNFDFDLSLHGYASLELRELKPGFPSRDLSPGYTFSAWFCIDRYDHACHTTLFGAFDESQTCFLLLYLERDSKQLVLQSSVTASRPSVRFKSIAFEEQRWYHLALVHHRPQRDFASVAFLYVNGKLCEQVKCHYPENPPIKQGENQPRVPFGSIGSNVRQEARVQAFFGTPRDLSPRPVGNTLSSKWRLANAHLFSDVLSDDLILVMKSLGPAYHGNFQDNLGSFQTYRASAALSIRNESHNAAASTSSKIAGILNSESRDLMPERNVVLAISTATVREGRPEAGLHVQSIKYTPAINFGNMPSKALRHLSGAVALNTAVPSVSKALSIPCGMALCAGGVTLCVNHKIEEHWWRLSGFMPIALHAIQQSTGLQETYENLSNLFQMVRDNWRTSDTFERENGYAIIAWLLRSKISDSSKSPSVSPLVASTTQDEVHESPIREILRIILEFVGYDSAEPNRSTLTNPLAYRALIVDCDIWRNSEAHVQQFYYQQFVTFALTCHNSSFNCRRLSRMRRSCEF